MSQRREEEEDTGASKTPEEEIEEKFATGFAGPTCRMVVPYQGQFEAPRHSFTGREPTTSRPTGTHHEQQRQQYPVPHPPLKVQRAGRPRIHPPKPLGISKPRGRPRGSKNKKPRKRKDASVLAERPPKRPRGRPRKWPPEMWEGFQRSQFAAATHQMQQLQRQQQLPEIPSSSHLYYEEPMPPQLPPSEEHSFAGSQPLIHVPYHHMGSQQDPQELSHLLSSPQQSQIPQHMMHESLPQQQQPHMHHPLPQHLLHHHQPQQHQEEQMLQIRPLYDQQQRQQPQHQRIEQEMMLSQQHLQEQHGMYYQEQMQPTHHPPHTTS